MRKSLLFLASVMVGAASAWAQWTKPMPTQFVPMADNGQTEQYLYNIEAGGFFMAGNDWQTRASVVFNEGAKVKMEALYHDDDKTEPSGTWALWNYVPKFKEYRKAFADNPQAIWTDNNSGANCDGWVVTALGANKYEITNPTAGQGKLGMATIDGTENTRLWLLDAADEENWINDAGAVRFANPCTTWAFVSVEEYDLLLPRIQAYEAAMSLRAAIDKAIEGNPGLTLAAQEAVYANTNSTADELKAAEASIPDAIKEYTSSKASVDNPADYTAFITNPSFEEGNANGWTYDDKNSVNGFGKIDDAKVAEVGSPGSTYYCSEADGKYLFNIWAWGNPITQKIENLPNGVYRLGAMVASSPDCTNVFITAETALGKFWHAITLEGNDTPNDLGNKQNTGTRGTMLAAVTDGTITIGAVGPDADGVSYLEGGRWWYKVDDFRLEYLGNSTESWNYFKENGDLTFEAYDEETVAQTSMLKEYNAAIENFNSMTEPDEIAATIATIVQLGKDIKANIEAYENLAKVVKAIETELGETSLSGLIETFADLMYAEDKETGDEAIADLKEQGVPEADLVEVAPQWLLGEEGRIYNTEEVNKYIETLKALHAYCVANLLTPGDDCTSMLTNASFADGFNGWTKPGAGSRGGFDVFPTVEVYDNTVDIYQVITNVPNGIYSLSCNAFYRPDVNGKYDGTEESPVALYMNDFQTPVRNIYGDAMPESKAVDMENCYITQDNVPEGYTVITGTPNKFADYLIEGVGYVPNSMVGASIAFKSGRYKQTVYGIVDNGTMKIGLTSNGVKAHWVLWSNFKLTFEGVNETAVNAIADKYVDDAATYMSTHEDEMSGKGIEALADAINAVEDAGDAQEKYDAVIALNKAMAAARENVAAVKAYNDARDKMTDAAENAENPTEEALAEYQELADIDIDGLTTDEIKALTDRINACTTALRIPNTEGATFNEPVEMTSVIINPDFETGNLEGWTIEVEDAKNKQFNDKTIENGEVSVSRFAEAWVNSANDGALGNGSIYQTIAALPAGAYLLEADVIAVWQGHDVAAEGVYLYAQEGTGEWNKAAVSTGDGKPEHAQLYFAKAAKATDLTIGLGIQSVKKANWVAADNFKLTYLGDAEQEEFKAAGIDATPVLSATPTAIYNAAGQRISTLAKGLNIIKTSDGTVRKVYVK